MSYVGDPTNLVHLYLDCIANPFYNWKLLEKQAGIRFKFRISTDFLIDMFIRVCAYQSWDTTSISLTAGCDLFMRYVTRTSALEYEDFNSARSCLIEHAEKFGEISCKICKPITIYNSSRKILLAMI